jgi:ABC-type lipoprotein release transport system permease subunit
VGVRGEVPILNADSKKPLLEPVPAGTMVVGWELHRSLKLKLGDRIQLLGREFTVGKLHPERGTKDDITIWINLKQAQELLDQPGQINGILALECVCAAESLSKVRSEIGRILPETQVIEFQSQMLARAEARQRAAAEAKAAMDRERQNRLRLRQNQAEFAAWAVPLVLTGSAFWIAFLSLSNVRERRTEIAVLRALGLRSRHILTLLLGRALLIGVAGAVIGSGLGLLVGCPWHAGSSSGGVASLLIDRRFWLAILVAGPLLAALSGWLPAFAAAQKDPAALLSEG